MVCLWESGKKPLSPRRLVEVLGKVGIPPEAVDAALLSDDLAFPPQGLSLPTEPSRRDRTRIHQTAAAAGGRAARATHIELLAESHRAMAREHRAWAATQWSRLAKRPAETQEMLIGALFGGARSWALAERLCLAATAAAADKASEALRLARLAVRVAERSPGGELWLLRLLGWCLCFLANVFRVGGDLPAAEETFAKAEDLWTRGAGGDPYGLLDGARRLDLRASLLMQQGHLEEALQLLDQVLAVASDDHTRGRLMIKKANMLILAGNYEASLEELRLAEPLIDEQSDQRLFLVHRFNRTLASCHLDRYKEAGALLGMVEVLAADLGNELDQVRTAWLKGRACAGLGRESEALVTLSGVRRYFLAKEIAYDFALVSLEVAVLHLERGRIGLVQELAEEMLWIFKTQKVHKKALAALTLFCHAAKEGEAGTEWTRRLIKFLYRAQHNPRLHFEP
jgi:tetratricopeptide (TPR) repeat protein